MLPQPKNIVIDPVNGNDANDGVSTPVKTEARARALATGSGDAVMGMLPASIPVGEIMATYNQMREA
jgi:hypothetical protein